MPIQTLMETSQFDVSLEGKLSRPLLPVIVMAIRKCTLASFLA